MCIVCRVIYKHLYICVYIYIYAYICIYNGLAIYGHINLNQKDASTLVSPFVHAALSVCAAPADFKCIVIIVSKCCMIGCVAPTYRHLYGMLETLWLQTPLQRSNQKNIFQVFSMDLAPSLIECRKAYKALLCHQD